MSFKERLDAEMRRLFVIHDGDGKNGYGAEVIAPFMAGAAAALRLAADGADASKALGLLTSDDLRKLAEEVSGE